MTVVQRKPHQGKETVCCVPLVLRLGYSTMATRISGVVEIQEPHWLLFSASQGGGRFSNRYHHGLSL